jgi:hypothetical protein
MANQLHPLFTDTFVSSLRSLIEAHHAVYPRIPPQGIFFESLVERAFRQAGWADTHIILTTPNSPEHDLLVGHTKISLKTQTGVGTNRELISITKLCTTEQEPWDSPTLMRHVLQHLSRYDYILMLRAIWNTSRTVIHYQLLDIPVPLLKMMANLTAVVVGRRSGRRSLGVDVVDNGETVFHVHFDGADGKCQISRLLVRRCLQLLEWDQAISV